MNAIASNAFVATDHVLSIIPSIQDRYDLAAYGFPGFEGSNIAASGDDEARGFTFRLKAENEMYCHEDNYEFDAKSYGAEGSHWVRAAARMREIRASVLRHEQLEEEGA